MRASCGVVLVALLLPAAALAAGETSSGDKLRMLYSNQFTFTDDGLPVITIELASGRDRVELSSTEGVVVRPDGDSGSSIRTRGRWTITARDTHPATVREWTVVGRYHPDDETGIGAELARWRSRGLPPQTFDIGMLFGIAGTTLDSRETLVAVAPVSAGRGAARARALARRFGVETSVYTEVASLPRGTLIASNGSVTVENPSVLWFYSATEGGSIQVDDIEVGTGGSQLHTGTEDRRYVGGVYVTLGKDGKMVVVNAVSIDRLLAGIVPSEIFPSAPSAALEAQAIAARTELLEKLGRRHVGDPFLLCSTQQCQVYSGAGREHPRTTAAVHATRGLVLMGEDHQLVDARYSAACGGYTEAKENIWGGSPDEHLQAVIDAIPGTPSARRFAGGIDASNLEAFLRAPADEFYEGATRFGEGRFRWQREVSAGELTRSIATEYPHVGRVLDLEPLERGRSGRIERLRIRGTEHSVIATGDLHLRRLLGGLRSTLFAVDKLGDVHHPTAFRFRGAGFGHGVGMCQVGAIGRAEHKMDYTEILDHYYRSASLKRLY